MVLVTPDIIVIKKADVFAFSLCKPGISRKTWAMLDGPDKSRHHPELLSATTYDINVSLQTFGGRPIIKNNSFVVGEDLLRNRLQSPLQSPGPNFPKW